MPVNRITVEVELPTGERLLFKCNDTRLTPDKSKFHVYGGTISLNGTRIKGARVSGEISNPEPDKKPGQRLPVKRIKYALAHAIAVRLGFESGTTAAKKVADWYPVQDFRDVNKARNHRSLKPFEIRLMDWDDGIVAVLTQGVEAGKQYEWLGLRYDMTKRWPDEGLSIVRLETVAED